MASRGTMLQVLLVAFALMAGGLVEGASGESSSAVRRLLAGRELRGASATVSPSTSCPIPCFGLLPTCCANTIIPGLLPVYFCANTQIDILNCGTCGNSCIANGLTLGVACCSGTCTNTLTDPNNCGICGNKCPQNDKCSLGLCNYGK